MSDRISELPLFILHKILAYLPEVDRGRISVLSKQWNSIHGSFPRLYYRQNTYLRPFPVGTPEYSDRLDHLITFIDTSLRSFVENGLRIEAFLLRLVRIRPNYYALINTWLPLVLSTGVSKLFFQVLQDGTKLTFYPLPPTVFSVHKFFNLCDLTLLAVAISEDMIRDIIRNCPNLDYFCLWYISGIKRLEISKLSKLINLTVAFYCPSEVESISIDIPSLQNFSCKNPRLCAFRITSCSNLNCLKLYKTLITDQQFNMHIHRFSLLETLSLSLCHVLQRIRIFLPRLKHLTIENCRAIKSIHIDALALSKFIHCCN